jgi:DNA-binding IclR family transcriptional regulator
MPDFTPLTQRRLGALALIRTLRRLDGGNGVKDSGIALDVCMLLFERADTALTVKELCALSGYSGPTVRLVMNRLARAAMVAGSVRERRTVAYVLTPRGLASLEAYVERIWEFGTAVARGEVDRFVAAVASDTPARADRRRRALAPARQEAAERKAAD